MQGTKWVLQLAGGTLYKAYTYGTAMRTPDTDTKSY